MNQNEFGKYLKAMRLKYGKTQEELASSIKKSKMLISGMESGKNMPPHDNSDIEKMVRCMGLNEEEEFELKCKASFARETLPDNLIDMIKEDERFLEILYNLKKQGSLNKNYDKIMDILRNGE